MSEIRGRMPQTKSKKINTACSPSDFQFSTSETSGFHFSVVIPAFIRNEEDSKNLHLCIESIYKSNPPPDEIIVVDDGSPLQWSVISGQWSGVSPPASSSQIPASRISPPLAGRDGVANLPIGAFLTDISPPLAGGIGGVLSFPPSASHLHLLIIRQDNQGPSGARNAGAAGTKGNIIVFVDQDVVIPGDAFAKLADSFKSNPDAAAVWGTVTASHPHRGIVSRYKNHTHRHFTLTLGREPRHITTMFAAVRREFFEKTGGFNTSIRTVSIEDIEFGRELFEAGGQIIFDPGIECEHRHRFTLYGAIKNDFHKVRCFTSATLRRRIGQNRAVSPEDPALQRHFLYLLGIPLGVSSLIFFLAGMFPLSIAFLIGLLILERDLWLYLVRQEGIFFAIRCMPLMLIERASVAAGIIAGLIDYFLKN